MTTIPLRALWVLWLTLHGHAVMQAGVYRSAAHCEQTAAMANASSPELGYFACFRQSVAKPFTY